MNDLRTSGSIRAETEPRSRNIDKIDLARLCELLTYNKDTGVFMWLKRTGPMCKLDRPAGKINVHGYRRIAIDGRSHNAAHLAWLYHYGEPPPGLIDHKNGNRSDNRIENLRLCTHSENSRNVACRSNNSVGLKGVSRFNKKYQRAKFRSTITVNKKRIFLGLFMTAEEAHAAYCQAAALMHGEFARLTKETTMDRKTELEKTLTSIRGKVRRAPEGIEKQRLELLGAQIENNVPAAYIQRQTEIMAGVHGK